METIKRGEEESAKHIRLLAADVTQCLIALRSYWNRLGEAMHDYLPPNRTDVHTMDESDARRGDPRQTELPWYEQATRRYQASQEGQEAQACEEGLNPGSSGSRRTTKTASTPRLGHQAYKPSESTSRQPTRRSPERYPRHRRTSPHLRWRPLHRCKSLRRREQRLQAPTNRRENLVQTRPSGRRERRLPHRHGRTHRPPSRPYRSLARARVNHGRRQHARHPLLRRPVDLETVLGSLQQPGAQRTPAQRARA